LAALFRRTAGVWAEAAAAATRWRGLTVFGLDGTTLRLADTPENVATFGRPGTSRGGAAAGYPQLRCVVLSVLRHHLLAAVHFGPYRTSELELAATLWAELPDRSLVILDRGFAIRALPPPQRSRAPASLAGPRPRWAVCAALDARRAARPR
jgi:hypothetical protein